MGVTNIFNKREAFTKLANTSAFKAWHKVEVAKRLGIAPSMESGVSKAVDEMMQEKNLKIEYL